MKLIVCLDERGGMMFNHRRQSRDRVLLEDLAKEVGDARLYASAYSEPLLKEAGIPCLTIPSAPEAIEKEAYCFVEDLSLSQTEAFVDEVILYRWNRHYPADRYFDMNLDSFRLVEAQDFAGFSHDNITKERWKK